jgi:hypothetical protein
MHNDNCKCQDCIEEWKIFYKYEKELEEESKAKKAKFLAYLLNLFKRKQNANS